jgi:hypothetical protein
MNNKMTVVIISLSMLMSLAVSAAGRPSLRAHEQRITTLEGQTSTLATDLADIALTPGPKGDVGEAGTKGAEGVKGDVGEDGTQGAPGIKGDDGAAGNRGEDGSDGLNGIDAIAGTAYGQMQYWDGTSWRLIDAPDLMTDEAQVLTPRDGGFRWATAASISPGDQNCPAFTFNSLRRTLSAYLSYTSVNNQFISYHPGSLFMNGMNSSGEHWDLSIYMNDYYLSIDSIIHNFLKMHENYYVTLPDGGDESFLITESQLQKCREILGHVMLPFITP